MDENDDKTFYLLGYYDVIVFDYGRDKLWAAGLSDDIKVRLGRIRDYETLSHAIGLATLSTISAAVASLLLF